MRLPPFEEMQPAYPARARKAQHQGVSEFWTPVLKSEGWSPQQSDNFVFMGACATNERAYEFKDPETGEAYGVFTSALVAAIKESPPGQRLSYNMLKRCSGYSPNNIKAVVQLTL